MDRKSVMNIAVGHRSGETGRWRRREFGVIRGRSSWPRVWRRR